MKAKSLGIFSTSIYIRENMSFYLKCLSDPARLKTTTLKMLILRDGNQGSVMLFYAWMYTIRRTFGK